MKARGRIINGSRRRRLKGRVTTSNMRRADIVSIPCRGCGKTFHKLTIAEGIHPFECRSCGIVTKARVRCWADFCRVFTSAERTPSASQLQPGRPATGSEIMMRESEIGNR